MIVIVAVCLTAIALSFSAILRCSLGRVQQQMEYRPN